MAARPTIAASVAAKWPVLGRGRGSRATLHAACFASSWTGGFRARTRASNVSMSITGGIP
jgi:hypothetical protein